MAEPHARKLRSDSLQIDDHRQIDRRAAPPLPTADAPPRDTGSTNSTRQVRRSATAPLTPSRDRIDAMPSFLAPAQARARPALAMKLSQNWPIYLRN